MLAVAFPRRTLTLVGALAAVICTGTATTAVLGNAGASPGRDKLAARLMRLDPAARPGGNTHVATASSMAGGATSGSRAAAATTSSTAEPATTSSTAAPATTASTAATATT